MNKNRTGSIERRKKEVDETGVQIQEGNITSIAIREKKCFDKNVQLLKPGEAPPFIENDHEVFIGYESGAVGLIKIWLEAISVTKQQLEFHTLISPQRVVAELKTKHILCMHPVENYARDAKPYQIYKRAQQADFKLVVGYFANFIQIFDLMESSDGKSYVFIDQRRSDVSYHEKPGIQAVESLYIHNRTPAGDIAQTGKALLVQGGFDSRVRLFSAKTLKMLAALKFHKDIVNKVSVEAVNKIETDNCRQLI